jgi:hypothetical protein
MAKNQYLSSHQKGIVTRYYQHQDSRVVANLQELLSDLFLAEKGPSADKKWAAAERELAKTNADPTKVAGAIAARDIKALGAIIAAPGLSAAKPKPPPTPDRDDV